MAKNFFVRIYYKINTETFSYKKMYLISKKKGSTCTPKIEARNRMKEMNKNVINITFENNGLHLLSAS